MDASTRQNRFLALLNPQYDAFARYVRAMVRNPEDARDIVGETLLIAFEHFDEIRETESFLFYLITIAKRLHWKAAKRRKRQLPLERQHEDLRIDPGASPDLSPDIAALYAAIDRLPLRLREALVLFELTGLRLEEIRRIQGGTLSGVKSRVARARKKLARMLGADIPTEMTADLCHDPGAVHIEAEG